MLSKVCDIYLGDFLRGGASLNGVIFGGKTEGVVAKGAKNIYALLSIEPRENVDDGEITDVADMKAGAGGIRKHFGEHFLGLAFNFGSLKSLRIFPDFLPFLFDFLRFVSIHFYIIP